ncbi:hypothetical protein GGR55DRAFT_581847 [Xylaria sp. FL0064]|nr:hypothetical protein GGR55DRAFT_581847 [Xylaria sp. FL0064]
MSLLHRWSLPSRGFTRDRSQDGESTDQSKYPTIHISQLRPRRRANLSSVFSTLFEKPENRQSIRHPDDRSQVADDLPLLASRRENVRPDVEFRYSQCQNTTTPVETVSLRKYGMPGPKSKSGTTIDTTSPLLHLTPGAFDQVTRQADEMPRVRSFSLSNTETHGTETRDETASQKSVEASGHRDRNGSASSSYPSEGLRSPVSGCCSPEPATAHSKEYFAEYRRFGRYSSHGSWPLSNVHLSEAPARDAVVDGDRDPLATGDVTPNCVFTGQNRNDESPSFLGRLGDPTQLPCSNQNQAWRTSRILHRLEPQQVPSSNSEITVPILENEDAMSSQLEVSFMSYKRPEDRTTTDDGGDDQQPEVRNLSSVDRLRPSADTGRTMLTAIRRSSTSDEESAWSTIHKVRERPLSRATSWMQLLAKTPSNGSSNTLAQRLQKLKLKIWAKRVCFKTKARFELVGRPVSTGKVARSKGRRRRRWRLEMKKARKGLGAKKQKGKKRWNVGEMLEVTKKRMMVQHREMADHFFDTLAKRKSLQFALFRSEKGDKIAVSHKRVRSCPANMGL